MRMLVLGAGLQGSACAYDLLQNDEVTEVRLADVNTGHLPEFLAPYSGKRLIPTPLDVRNSEGVRALMREHEKNKRRCRRDWDVEDCLEMLAGRTDPLFMMPSGAILRRRKLPFIPFPLVLLRLRSARRISPRAPLVKNR